MIKKFQYQTQQKDTYQKNQYTNIEKELVKIVVQ